MNTTDGFVRAPVYGTDPQFVNGLGSQSTQNLRLTAASNVFSSTTVRQTVKMDGNNLDLSVTSGARPDALGLGDRHRQHPDHRGNGTIAATGEFPIYVAAGGQLTVNGTLSNTSNPTWVKSGPGTLVMNNTYNATGMGTG